VKRNFPSNLPLSTKDDGEVDASQNFSERADSVQISQPTSLSMYVVCMEIPKTNFNAAVCQLPSRGARASPLTPRIVMVSFLLLADVVDFPGVGDDSFLWRSWSGGITHHQRR
jgi:hypothetical protein